MLNVPPAAKLTAVSSFSETNTMQAVVVSWLPELSGTLAWVVMLPDCTPI
jgi:hypothetical protein